ncbi:MAG: leader peptidase (prepilin peptidase)/N-methyltransferase [Planctomycetota bacterium]|jgi:leader peptidase (prepilin peptidase)/N-methyltransferase
MFIPTTPMAMLITWSTLGLVVGSFLNVCIYRWPLEDQTVMNPKRSRCPKCDRNLHWYENIPVFSWLIQLGKCRGCANSISYRYPLVELITAAFWGLSAWVGEPSNALVAVRVLIFSSLIVATFIDFDHFLIPDEISIGGMIAAPILCLLMPQLHEGSAVAIIASGDAAEVTRFGAFTASMAGLAAGGGILWLIGWLGAKAYGTDAMGFGDVKLLAAGGGFIGAGGALVALMIASAIGSVVGVFVMIHLFRRFRSRARKGGHAVSLRFAIAHARKWGRYIPFGPYLAMGIGIVLLYWDHVMAAFT